MLELYQMQLSLSPVLRLTQTLSTVYWDSLRPPVKCLCQGNINNMC